MRAGTLRHRVTLQSQQLTSDGQGGQTESWTDFAVGVYCRIEPLQGAEKVQAQQVNDELTHRISLRYLPGLSSKMRVLYGSRVFLIESTLNDNERNAEMVMFAKELVAP